MQTNTHNTDRAIRIIKTTVARYDAKIAGLLPKDLENLEKMNRRGSAYHSLQNKTHHFLQTHGKCIDVLEMKSISITEVDGQVEYGAFAKRDISKGELIVPALLYPVDKSLLKDHHMMNYCFGHELQQSSVLLCHVTLAALIRHKRPTSRSAGAGAGVVQDTCTSSISNSENSENECKENEKRPNADYIWSTWNFQNKYAHDVSPMKLYQVRAFIIIIERTRKWGTHNVGDVSAIMMFTCILLLCFI